MFITPFLIGLASSLHCIGMCSPLVMAVSKAGRQTIFRNLAYNAGRIMTYALSGSIVSYIGAGLNLAGIQQGVSISVGTIILIIGIASVNVKPPRFINHYVIKLMAFARSKGKLNPVFLGMINGLLPCGMTLIALTYCVTLKWPADGFLAMVYFGLGTIPAMLGFSFFTRSLIQKLPISYRRIQTALLIVSGVLLIGRAIDPHGFHIENGHEIVVCGAGGKK